LPTALIAQVGNAEADFSGAATNCLSPFFSLLDQAASWGAIFDQYRIDRVDHVFRPLFAAQNFSSGAGDLPPSIYTVIDYDDNVTANIASLRQYTSLAIHEFETFRVSYRPHIALAAYSGAFTSYANVVAGWIDLGSQGVGHFGCKVAVGAGSGVGQTNLQKWRIDTTLTISLRNVR